MIVNKMDKGVQDNNIIHIYCSFYFFFIAAIDELLALAFFCDPLRFNFFYLGW